MMLIPKKGDIFQCCECGMELIVTIGCKCESEEMGDICFKCCDEVMKRCPPCPDGPHTHPA